MKKLFVLLLIIVFLTQINIFAISQHTDYLNESKKDEVVNYVKNQIIDLYSEYYSIPKIDVEIEYVDASNNGLIVHTFVNFTKILKIKSAEDLPFVKGMILELENIEDNYEKMIKSSYINSVIRDLQNNYIGIEQEETSEFAVKISTELKRANNYEQEYSMFFIGDDGSTATIQECKLPNEELMINGGKDKIKKLKFLKNELRTTSVAQDYDRILARDYVRTWTDSCGACHCFECDPSKSVYNPKFQTHHKRDCANYVSQAINAGGIETNSKWRPGLDTWDNTGHSRYGLVDYLVDNDLFFKTSDKYKACAGSVIMWLGKNTSHVGMVDQNDTITMTYCSHTNDRKNYSFKNFSGIEFYVPTWDSYSGTWISQ